MCGVLFHVVSCYVASCYSVGLCVYDMGVLCSLLSLPVVCGTVIQVICHVLSRCSTLCHFVWYYNMGWYAVVSAVLVYWAVI